MNLYQAAKENNYKGLKTLIKRGFKNREKALYGACEGSHLSLIKLFYYIPKINIDHHYSTLVYYICKGGSLDLFNKFKYNSTFHGLLGACEGGHYDLAQYIINNYDVGNIHEDLHYACIGGNKELIDFFISKYDIWDYNYALAGAYQGGSKDIIDFITAMGGKNLNYAFYGACKGGHLDLVKQLISKVTNTEPNNGLGAACEIGNKKIIDLLAPSGQLSYNQEFALHNHEHYYLLKQYKKEESTFKYRILTLMITQLQILPVNRDCEYTIYNKNKA